MSEQADVQPDQGSLLGQVMARARELERRARCASPHRVVIDVSQCRHPIVHRAAEERGWDVVDGEPAVPAPATVTWYETTVSAERLRKLAAREGVQRVNHFPMIELISRKAQLAVNVSRMARYLPGDFDFLPRTFVDAGDFSRHKQGLVAQRQTRRPYYIVKPVGGCMGRGISLSSNPPSSVFPEHIVQEYIDRPLLVDGRKCDLRCYALLLSVAPRPRIYFYHEGLVRICAEPYQAVSDANTGDHCVHLTNFAVNRRHQSFRVEDGDTGGKRSFQFFSRRLAAEGHDPALFWRRVHAIIVKTVLAVIPAVAAAYKSSCGGIGDDGFRCFELLGCDILIDEDGKPWLAEVNHSPSLVTDTTFDERFKLGLLTDMFAMLDLPSAIDRDQHRPKEVDMVDRGTLSVHRSRKREQDRWMRQAQRRRAAADAQPGQLAWQRIYPTDNPEDAAAYARVATCAEDVHSFNAGEKANSKGRPLFPGESAGPAATWLRRAAAEAAADAGSSASAGQPKPRKPPRKRRPQPAAAAEPEPSPRLSLEPDAPSHAVKEDCGSGRAPRRSAPRRHSKVAQFPIPLPAQASSAEETADARPRLHPPPPPPPPPPPQQQSGGAPRPRQHTPAAPALRAPRHAAQDGPQQRRGSSSSSPSPQPESAAALLAAYVGRREATARRSPRRLAAAATAAATGLGEDRPRRSPSARLDRPPPKPPLPRAGRGNPELLLGQALWKVAAAWQRETLSKAAQVYGVLPQLQRTNRQLQVRHLRRAIRGAPDPAAGTPPRESVAAPVERRLS